MADCKKGFYCPPGSTSPQQQRCPIGSYCIEGTTSPTPCPNGTYGSSESLASVDSCSNCTAGFFCSGLGQNSTSGLCYPGYYCPPGSTSPDDPTYKCTVGHHCPIGSADQIPCNNGQYQDKEYQDTCELCPEGFFCTGVGPVVSPQLCPEGGYCPKNSSSPILCQPGTYNNKSGSILPSACLPCQSGYYCKTPGSATSKGDGPCQAGYYCLEGSTSDQQYPCPDSSYCEIGSSGPIRCPSGTYTVTTSNVGVNYCLDCPPGMYCVDNNSSIRLLRNCSDGYICTGGSNTSTPEDLTMGYICPAGYFCKAGQLVPQACQPGSYQPSPGKSICESCPSKHYCPEQNMTSPIICPAGLYCAGGVSYKGTPCPVGRFSNESGLENETQCTLCPAGRFVEHISKPPSLIQSCFIGFVLSLVKLIQVITYVVLVTTVSSEQLLKKGIGLVLQVSFVQKVRNIL